MELAGLIQKGEFPETRVIRSADYIPTEELNGQYRNPELAEYYLHTGGMLSVQTKRGCPHRCSYCSYPVLEGSVYRFRPAEKVIDEIDYLIKNHKADFIMFTDSVFNDPQGKYLELAEGMIKRGAVIPWSCYLRPEHFSKEEAEILVRAGLHSVEWGTDCCSDATLKGMNKDFRWDDVVYASNLFTGLGVPGSHFIMFSGPGETEATVEEGLANLERLERCVVFAGTGIRIFPGTPIFRTAVGQGIIKKETPLLEPVYYFSPDVDKEWLHKKLCSAFTGRLERIYIGNEDPQQGKAKLLHEMGYRGPVWDLLLRERKSRRRRGS